MKEWHVEHAESPFRHFQVNQVLSDDLAERLLQWLETTELFIPRQEDFYRSSAFHLSEQNVPEQLADFFSKESMAAFRKRVEELFGVPMREEFMISANRYVAGQGTLIHTDFVEREYRDQYFFTHRFLLYLNRGWSEEDGGVLGLFETAAPDSLAATVRPVHNTGVGLAMGRRSFHAVSAVSGGERYTLNFTFLSQAGEYEVE